MKTVQQLHDLLYERPFAQVDAHIHTHLCDGASDMTVENIARCAAERGMSAIILTPHFHKQVRDESAVLYSDTDEAILLQLREQIEDYYARHGRALTILLSPEADILDTDGTTALTLTRDGEAAVDLVTPTVNYHPLLPLKAVEVTYGAKICQIHADGLYARYAQEAGGVRYLLQALYEAEVNAIRRSPYPCMLGHFLAAHSHAREQYSWFGAKAEHLDVMEQGAAAVLDVCAQRGAMIDLTGLHPVSETAQQKQERDGFFFDFQVRFLKQCRERGVIALAGTDAHSLGMVGKTDYYAHLNTFVK